MTKRATTPPPIDPTTVPTNGQVYAYNTTTGLMEPVTPSAGAAALALTGWANVALHPTFFGANAFQITGAANTVFACRVTIPKTGTMSDLSVWMNNATGNIIGGVYDTGQDTATVRKLLTSLGSVALTTVNGFNSCGNPALAVTQGQQLELAFITSGAGANCWAAELTVGNLPAPYNGGAAVLGKQAWKIAPGSFALPATVAEAAAVTPIGSSQIPAILAYIT